MWKMLGLRLGWLKVPGVGGLTLGQVPLGISRVYILYALAKQSQSLGAGMPRAW